LRETGDQLLDSSRAENRFVFRIRKS